MQRVLHGDYPTHPELEQRWREAVSRLGGRESVAGTSAEGRALWRFDLGTTDPNAPAILLTALIHGVELIGSIALLDAVASLGRAGSLVLGGARLVVMPIVNPDALATNMDRLARGRRAFQRRNARGVDLNRNFPVIGRGRSWHPLSGSRFRWSPYHRGPHPLSEPESQAVARVAEEIRPSLAMGFHSFGNLLLFPWAHSRTPNPRFPAYQRLAHAFTDAARSIPYRFRQAIDFYPTFGDLDDWLDSTYGTMALTVEVSGLERSLLHPRRIFNPFCWMNPRAIGATISNATPGIVGLMAAALAGAGT
jgi:carboxypeptidase T